MWPISNQFVAAISGNHRVATKVEILQNDEVIFDLTAAGAVADGSVTASKSAIRRSAQMTIVDRDGTLTPNDFSDLLVPIGNQIRLWRGVEYPAATDVLSSQVPIITTELVPIGTFRFIATTSEYPKIVLNEMYDRAWVVQGARFENTMHIQYGTSYNDAIASILAQAYPGVPTNFPDTDEVTNRMTFDAEADPWQVCQDLAANIGMAVYFDAMGVAQLHAQQDVDDGLPVWTFDSGSVTSMALPGLKKNWFGGEANAVIVIGASTSLAAPIRGTAYDQNPLSPTQYGGAYGKRPTFIRDEKISSQAQADARAQRELQSIIGMHETIDIPSMVNPAFEIDDIISVVDTTRRINNVYMIDSFTCPLRAATPMQLGTRLQHTVVTT